MKSIVKGKIVNKIYFVDCKYSIPQNIEEKSVLVRKPKIKIDERITYENICEFEGNYVSNKKPKVDISNMGFFATPTLNISENESVEIENTIFRADLNEQHIFTNKVIKENEINKEIAEKELKPLLKTWNKQEIEKDERLLAYCHLHRLVIENIDIDELRKVVYGTVYNKGGLIFNNNEIKSLNIKPIMSRDMVTYPYITGTYGDLMKY